MDKTNGFVDLHAHILPKVDDGASSMEETLQMLRIAQEEEIRTIIATPHYIVGTKNNPVKRLREVLNQVQEEALKLDEGLKLLLGNEIYYSESIVDALKSGAALTLADSRYVLVEFSMGESYHTMFKGLSNLLNAGYWPIIAHVERYRCLHNNENLIDELVNLGCYIQMNCGSLKGGFLSSEAVFHRKLIKQGLVHFLGSDCHDGKLRVPNMKTTELLLQKKCDERILNRIFYENPFKVLENTCI